jgi:hypothetical protein
MQNLSRLKVLILLAVVSAVAGLGYLKYTDVQAPGAAYNYLCFPFSNEPPCKALRGEYIPPQPPPPPPVSITTSSTSVQEGQIDEHLFVDNTLRDVNFCGNIYKVKQVMIDGVDVVQRVAEIATKNLIPENFKVGPYGADADIWKDLKNENHGIEKAICENLQSNTKETTLVVTNLNSGKSKLMGKQEEYSYGFILNGTSYIVSVSTFDIYTSSNYDGALVGPIGKLK